MQEDENDIIVSCRWRFFLKFTFWVKFTLQWNDAIKSRIRTTMFFIVTTKSLGYIWDMYSSCWKVPIWCICCWILCTKGFQDLANEDNILLKVYPCPIPLFTIFIQYTSSLLKADFSTLKNFCQVIWLWQNEVSWSEKVFLSNRQNSWYQPSLKGGNS